MQPTRDETSNPVDPEPIESAPSTGKTGRSLLVVIPCLDEEATVARVVEGIPRALSGICRVEVLVIDDGSQDATGERAREAGAGVVRHEENLGLGVTFREAVEIALARGIDLMVHIDGDGQFDPGDIPLLVAPVVAGEAHMATASRFLEGETLPEMPAVKIWGNRGVARIVWLLSGQRFRDVSCGFRAFSSEALLRMNLFGSFTYTQETFLDLAFKGMSIRELPVKVRGTREVGSSRLATNLFRYAFKSLRIMLGSFVSYRPFRFFAAISSVFLLAGLGLLGFLAAHYLRTGSFSPHIWAGFVGGSSTFLGISIGMTGVVGEILLRIRRNQEDMLYLMKRADWKRRRAERTATGG